MNRLLITLFLAAVTVFFTTPLRAQNYTSAADELFFTYIGLTAGGGYTSVKSSEWVEGKGETSYSATGYTAQTGLLLDAYVTDFAGEFRAVFDYSGISDSRVKVHHATYATNIKYCYPITPSIDLTTGLGVYFEGAPASRSYNGAGGEYTLGSVFKMSGRWDWKIVCDVAFRYGFFGNEAKGKKLFVGGSIGVTQKVGRS